MKIFLIAAVRGRKPNIDDESYEQKLEINEDGICNSLTTVLKDNYVIEIEKIETCVERG